MSGVPKLFSYIIPIDDGAAPNPFGRLCTLAICKPGIRKAAQVGDWVVGLGSKNAPSGNFRGRVVYAMRVEESIPLYEYDRRAAREWPRRIPNLSTSDYWDRVGDCIYDYRDGIKNLPRQRSGVHHKSGMTRDLSGKNVLISRDFYYFGRKPIKLKPSLLAIGQLNRGFRSHLNDEFFDEFVKWIRNTGYARRKIHALPDYVIKWGRREDLCGPCEPNCHPPSDC